MSARRVLPVVVDLAHPVPDVAAHGAAALSVTVLWRGQPVGTVQVTAGVDAVPGPLLARRLAVELAPALSWARTDELVARAPDGPPCSGTVVVCTRDRHDSLQRCLASIARSDPTVPLDVLVVDNGPGDERTRRMVEGFGFRWVHEALPGLDRARNRGLLEAQTEVVLFTDDDVEVHPSWAARLLGCFTDPRVGAATGLVLPAVLDTAHQRSFEQHAGFSRGLRRREVSGSHTDPLSAGVLGAGASLAVRRDLMTRLGGFPEELDGGMPTKSGGDTFGLYRVLRAGARGVYEPRALAFHWHRDSPDELVRTLTGYSTGTYAFLTAALVREHDLTALRSMASWSRTWVGRRLLHAVLGRASAPPVELAWAEVRGALATPRAYRDARRVVRARGELPVRQAPRTDAAQVGPEQVRPGLGDRTTPAPVTVVVPTRGRRDSVVRLLHLLDAQDPLPAQVVVVVDGDVDGTAAAVQAQSLRMPVELVVQPVGRGAAVARNAGVARADAELVLFLDDDVRPAPGLVGAHLSAHRAHDVPVAVVGPCPPVASGRNDPHAVAVREWWVVHTGRLLGDAPLSFTDAGTGNLSIPRRVFEELGGFAELARREDWELGHRLLQRGVPLVAAATAVAEHDADEDHLSSLRDRAQEGAGDVAVVLAHPQLAHLLPLSRPGRGLRHELLLSAVFARPDLVQRSMPVVAAVGAGLTAVGARHRFQALHARATRLAYWSGVAQATGSLARLRELVSRAGDAPGGVMAIELTQWPWPPPLPGTTTLALSVDGELVGRAPVAWGGFPWSPEVFAQRVRHELQPSLALVLASRGARA